MNENKLDHMSATGVQTKPIGRILRFLLGGALIAIIVPYYLGSSWKSTLAVFGFAIALLVFYMLTHFLVSNYFPHINMWFGLILTIVPVVLVFFLPGTQGDVGAVTFISVSLLLTSLRGDPGCEVMSIPNIIFRKRAQLCCILFSPIDRLDQKIFKRG